MFDNPAGKIKLTAKVLFAVSIVLSIVFAILFGRDYSWSDYHFHFGIFILILIPGIAVSYVYCLLIYGFGQLIENTESREVNIDEKPSFEKGEIINENTESKRVISEESKPSNIEWKCPKCGKIHYDYVEACSCGEKMP